MTVPANMIDRLGGRRFIVTAASGAAMVLLMWFGKISDIVFRDCIIALPGAFIAAETYKGVKARSDQAKTEIAAANASVGVGTPP